MTYYAEVSPQDARTINSEPTAKITHRHEKKKKIVTVVNSFPASKDFSKK